MRAARRTGEHGELEGDEYSLELSHFYCPYSHSDEYCEKRCSSAARRRIVRGGEPSAFVLIAIHREALQRRCQTPTREPHCTRTPWIRSRSK